MFKDRMVIRDGDEKIPLAQRVNCSRRPPMVFQYWLAELSRDILRLGVYFRAIGVMLQVPDGGQFTWVDDDETEHLTAEADYDTLCNVLAEAFEMLGVKHLIDELHELKYSRQELPEAWQQLLTRRRGQKQGLHNVIAGCLDALLVGPGMEEIDAACELHWWQRWRPAV